MIYCYQLGVVKWYNVTKNCFWNKCLLAEDKNNQHLYLTRVSKTEAIVAINLRKWKHPQFTKIHNYMLLPYLALFIKSPRTYIVRITVY